MASPTRLINFPREVLDTLFDQQSTMFFNGRNRSKSERSNVNGNLKFTYSRRIEKGNIKASVSDIFWSMKWKGTSNFAGQVMRANGQFESRQFKLFFTYRFGNNQVKAARQRKTAAEEERKRVGSQGGGLNSQ